MRRNAKAEFQKEFVTEDGICMDVRPCGPDCPFFEGIRFNECPYEKNLIRGEVHNFIVGGETIRAKVISGDKTKVVLRRMDVYKEFQVSFDEEGEMILDKLF